jgi:hypothetical protein
VCHCSLRFEDSVRIVNAAGPVFFSRVDFAHGTKVHRAARAHRHEYAAPISSHFPPSAEIAARSPRWPKPTNRRPRPTRTPRHHDERDHRRENQISRVQRRRIDTWSSPPSSI